MRDESRKWFSGKPQMMIFYTIKLDTVLIVSYESWFNPGVELIKQFVAVPTWTPINSTISSMKKNKRHRRIILLCLILFCRHLNGYFEDPQLMMEMCKRDKNSWGCQEIS